MECGTRVKGDLQRRKMHVLSLRVFSAARFLFLSFPLKAKTFKIILFGFFLLSGGLLGEHRVKCGLFCS